MKAINQIYQGNCLSTLKSFDSESINCCVTSPPYWALRDYGVTGQLGLEPTLEEYINKLCNIFNEVKRVLKKDGTCWVVIGDSYLGGKASSGGKQKLGPMKDLNNQRNSVQVKKIGIEKSLGMIPFRFAIEMVNSGWILRNTIIWYKPNCMPASVKDRFTVDFEYVFFFVKNKKYWFEQQLEKSLSPIKEPKKIPYSQLIQSGGKETQKLGTGSIDGRNKRVVWQVTTKPFSEAHFATYPPDLIEPMIKAGCPENGVVLDPFFGAGTTGLVAKKLNRNYIGIELNEEYIKIAQNRINNFTKQLTMAGVE